VETCEIAPGTSSGGALKIIALNESKKKAPMKYISHATMKKILLPRALPSPSQEGRADEWLPGRNEIAFFRRRLSRQGRRNGSFVISLSP
jgi:hypothetical protein